MSKPPCVSDVKKLGRALGALNSTASYEELFEQLRENEILVGLALLKNN